MLLFFVTSAFFSLHLAHNIMQCFMVLNCFVVNAIFEHILPGADEQELATPILSLCHGIFTD